MKMSYKLSQFFLVFLLAFASVSVYAKTNKGISVGSTIELKATKKAGVPLHREAKSSMMGRAPHGSKATVLAIKKHWYQIKLKDGKKAWIIKKYIAKSKVAKKSAPAKKAPAPAKKS